MKERVLEMPMATITNNLDENITFKDYAVNAYNDREWGGDGNFYDSTCISIYTCYNL